jgi:hypothetical protein
MARETESKQFFIDLDKESNQRFGMGRFMLFDDDVFEPITSHLLESVVALESGGQYTVAGDDFRPDQVSNKIYGTTEFWWIILVYNGKISFNDIQHGDELNYPPIQAIEDLYFSLKINQNKVDRD